MMAPATLGPFDRSERLMNLVIALMHSRNFRTAAWIRRNVEGYNRAASDDAFARMFERDKQDLRDYGIPIETGGDDGYRISPADMAMPNLEFTSEEIAVLAVAARLWENTVLAESSRAGLRKIQESATLTPSAQGEHSEVPLVGRIRITEPVFDDLLAAIRAQRRVQFHYAGIRDEKAKPRSVEPWGMAHVEGSWYLVGRDRDRADTRTFKLARIVGSVRAVGRGGAVQRPADFDLAGAVRLGPESDGEGVALLSVRAGCAAGLRRQGTRIGPGQLSGYDDIQVPLRSVGELARHVAGHGPDVIAIDPPELRAATVAILRQAGESS